MEMTPGGKACIRAQSPMDPTRTIVPTNASKNKVVDKQLDLLLFSWWRRQQHLQQPEREPQEQQQSTASPHPDQRPKTAATPQAKEAQASVNNVRCNSLIPFYTATKPTCGYRFSRETDHKRKVIGIPASNPVMWRNNVPCHLHPKTAPKK
ncbi:putative uncharacterized protein CIMIP3 [Engraulis encrasicolus]|uniref:putative uncharacterized protein CIMIP3 n=1 Tax=Engraulis encrasicolus TaxID=184585 RepID=UPI002FCF455E